MLHRIHCLVASPLTAAVENAADVYSINHMGTKWHVHTLGMQILHALQGFASRIATCAHLLEAQTRMRILLHDCVKCAKLQWEEKKSMKKMKQGNSNLDAFPLQTPQVAVGNASTLSTLK